MTHPGERRGEIGGARRPKDHEPRWRHATWKLDWIVRRIVPFVALALAAFAVFGVQSKVDSTQAQVEAQKVGRQVAREVLCGGLYGVEEAGRLILLGELPPPAPSPPQLSASELKLRENYAKAYSLVVSRRVLEQAGLQAKGILRDDGTIDCDALNKIAVAEEKVAVTEKPSGNP